MTLRTPAGAAYPTTSCSRAPARSRRLELEFVPPGVNAASSESTYVSALKLDLLAREPQPHGAIVAQVTWHR